MAEGTLIVSRRNFIIRALGFTAAGASLAMPVKALDTPTSRVSHHIAEIKSAFADHYGADTEICSTLWSNDPSDPWWQDYGGERFWRRDYAYAMISAHRRPF